jgi:hypothetical protein
MGKDELNKTTTYIYHVTMTEADTFGVRLQPFNTPTTKYT